MRNVFKLVSILLLCSVGQLRMADAQTLPALQRCLTQNVSGGEIALTPKPQVSQYHTIIGATWAFRCDGPLAQTLWTELYPYRRTEPYPWTDTDNTRLESFRVGDNSHCTRVLFTPTGSPGNSFYCHVFLDLTQAVLENLH
jgi:hypothetical protein